MLPATKSKRNGPETCPVCAAAVPINAKGSRRMHYCTKCGATQRADLTCAHCSENRIWEGNGGAFCQGCGHEAEYYDVEIID